jgi:hypothetical protein
VPMTTWKVVIRVYHFIGSKDYDFSVIIATRGSQRKDALKLARSLYSESWWENATIIDIIDLGGLRAAEGLEIPREED